MMNSSSERRMMTRIIWSLCLIFCLSNSILVIASPAIHSCLPDQRDALWEFKNEFYVPSPVSNFEILAARIEKWRNNTDCCSWDGVSCDPKTGVVVGLELMYSYLNGPLRSNSSLFRLQHLQSLNLSFNNISGILLDSIDNLKHLRVLSLGDCNLFGKIPSSLGNISHLTELDLSNNDFTSEETDSMSNLNRLTDFQFVLLNLSSLINLDLRSNQFKGMLPSNMSCLSKLQHFDISGNSFSGTIPSSLFMLPSLKVLDLRRNDFRGPLEIGNISSPSNLQRLFIGENNFSGLIPSSISKLVGLSDLSLSFWNTGREIVDFSIFLHLKTLSSLDLSYLNTRSIDLSIFSHLMSLIELDLSGNNLKISSTLYLPSSIEKLILASCNISEFPKFLQNQTSLQYLDISANHIDGQVPESLWSLPKLGYVNIAQNSFSGGLTMLPNSVIYILIGSDNQFSGEIPRTLCELGSLFILVLSNNNFSGSIPRCFENSTLLILHVRNNSLSGVIPEEIINVNLIISLDVGRNRLSGQLPKSLINCTHLEFLNVEDNRINDTFPFWLRSLPILQILVLRSNEFYGPIFSPEDSLSFSNLRIFDISENSFSGVLPSNYFVGWSAISSMVGIVHSMPGIWVVGDDRDSYHKSVFLTNKGLKMELVGSGFNILQNH